MSNVSFSKYNLFSGLVLKFPFVTLAVVIIVTAVLGYNTRNFRLDASSETLVLEGDKDFLYAQEISERYGGQEFLALTYSTGGDIFTDESIEVLKQLRGELQGLENIESVTSILDVPLLQSPPLSLKELTGELPTLETPEVDKQLAKVELSTSPMYKQLLLSEDAKTTMLMINFAADTKYEEYYNRRSELRRKQDAGIITEQESAELERVIVDFRDYRDQTRKRRHSDIAAIRGIADKYRDNAELFLGGTGMITDDMITFIKKDLQVFGTGILVFLVIMLGIIFKRKRWIILPMLCCVVSVVCMIGLLGLFGWEVTVISSNFISLQLILTLAISIHLIVRYRELAGKYPEKDNRQLVLETVNSKIKPCVYAALTTIAGFGSLLLSDILPVITFGWMMVAGLVVSLIVTFMIFPAVLILLPKEQIKEKAGKGPGMIAAVGRFTQAYGGVIVVVSAAVLIASGIGMSKLTVENSFIDYFKKSTEIYQGMRVIDQQLGGTTPLDVIIEFAPLADAEIDIEAAVEDMKDEPEVSDGANEFGDFEDFAEFEEFDEFDNFDEAASEDKYWFTADKMSRIKAVHNYLDGLEATGKVISLATMLEIAESLNKGKELDSLELAVLYNETPDRFKDILIKPYVSIENDQVRVWVRIKDSLPGLRRNELLKQMQAELPEAAGMDAQKVRLTGMFVLYNNMLQSLFNSQILTLGLTAGLLTGMFLVLFRSIKVAIIAMVANLLPIAAVLGFMGWFDMPLDMMTITIAAISLGIAVDDTIHYIHRFKDEVKMDNDYIAAMHRCHGSIGNAMYFTSITIIIGFSILALSNFVPSVYFGLLTGFAMAIALVTALTLLPQLLIMLKPFGKEKS